MIVTFISLIGVAIASSGGCSNRNNAKCTSLEQIRKKTIDSGVLVLKKATGCAITITGGTEVNGIKQGSKQQQQWL